MSTKTPAQAPIPASTPVAVFINGRRSVGHVLAYDARTAEYTVKLKVSTIRAHAIWVQARRGATLVSAS